MSDIYEIIAHELAAARVNHPAFHSAHEGYAVLREEVDELWDAVKANHGLCVMAGEAIQVAAMAVRFIEDVCGGDTDA